jgi:hydroxymethylpyrimidine/phosphomethylpyrimidine kinase
VSTREPVVLTVAGSDPSGGAGIQADLKTATALGVYGASVLTAVTVQDTTGVHGVHAVPLEVVEGQLRSVLDDLDVRAAKVGMLGSPALVALVAELLADVPALVVDPVMVSTSGHRLLPQDAEAAVCDLLLPRATLVTPNLPEAAVLTGRPAGSGAETLAAALLDLGAAAALVKGGHAGGSSSDDLLVDADGHAWFRADRVDTPHTHGTGCTLSAAVAAHLATGATLRDAVAGAKTYLHEALASGAGRRVGRGRGPVDHLVRLRADGRGAA